MWLSASVVPIIPFTIPLFRNALTDTPTAYLIWIPIVAYFWLVWKLIERSRSDVGHIRYSLSACMALLAASAFWMTAFVEKWTWFYRWDLGLLMWPLWTAAIVGCWYGLAAVRAVIPALFYLVLVWQPLYLGLIKIVDPFLSNVTMSFFRLVTGRVDWILSTSSPIILRIANSAGIWYLIRVNQACSGADSVLALMVLFPVFLMMIGGTVGRKLLVLVIGCLAAFVFNLFRLSLIFLGLHFLGYGFAFDFLHPFLGTVLFILLVFLLIVLGSRQTLMSPSIQRVGAMIERPHVAVVWLTCVLSLVTAIVLIPMYFSPLSAL